MAVWTRVMIRYSRKQLSKWRLRFSESDGSSSAYKPM
ncbi:hypothetical protein QFZ91_006034 [Paraburkholderia sp. JPY419]